MSTLLHNHPGQFLFILAILLLISFLLGLLISIRHWRRQFLDLRSRLEAIQANVQVQMQRTQDAIDAVKRQ